MKLKYKLKNNKNWVTLKMEDKQTKLDTIEKFTMRMQKEMIIAALKKNGNRVTKQRLTLINIILENNCSCCKEIYYRASRIDRKIGIATAYRMIRLLEEIGALSRKNLYMLDYEKETEEEKRNCFIELDDGTIHPLLKKDFDTIVNIGMGICGYFLGHKVVSVVYNGEKIEWENE